MHHAAGARALRVELASIFDEMSKTRPRLSAPFHLRPGIRRESAKGDEPKRPMMRCHRPWLPRTAAP
jgi:hypothetical protein